MEKIRLYEKEEMKGSEEELPVRIPFWKFFIQYAEIYPAETENMFVKCFKGAGLDADDTKRRFFKVVDLIKICRSSYMTETVIVDSIKEIEITKDQYEKLFDCINEEINKRKPERKIKIKEK